MICPNCEANLLRRQRVNQTCSVCQRPFALEPKDNTIRLHDVRMRKLAAKLGDTGLRYTTTQLRYAVVRGRLQTYNSVRGWVIAFWCLAVAALAAFVGILGDISGVLVLVAAVVVAVVGIVLICVSSGAFRRFARVRMPIADFEWDSQLLARWVAIYRALPPGAVDERQVLIPLVPAPRFALVCPDHSVLACLVINNVHQTHGLALVNAPHQAPRGVPVLVCHDASIDGLLVVDEARKMFGEWVIDVGLTPRTVMGSTSAIALRDRPPDRARLELLAPLRLSDQERGWLADGWSAPIAAMGPAKLLAAVDHAVARIEDAGDPDRHAARQIGFLSWPTA